MNALYKQGSISESVNTFYIHILAGFYQRFFTYTLYMYGFISDSALNAIYNHGSNSDLVKKLYINTVLPVNLYNGFIK